MKDFLLFAWPALLGIFGLFTFLMWSHYKSISSYVAYQDENQICVATKGKNTWELTKKCYHN